MSSTPKPQYPQINGGDSQTPFEGLDAEKVAVHLGYTQGAVSKWIKRVKESRGITVIIPSQPRVQGRIATQKRWSWKSLR